MVQQMSARGEFDVTMTPQSPYESIEGVVYGRFSIAKVFRGDLEGESTVEMLSAGASVKGSAGYVAIERVKGRLFGRAGTFTLQHAGLMDRGAATLKVVVVPDTASDELLGLRGTMAIDIVDGKHFYTFDVELEALEK